MTQHSLTDRTALARQRLRGTAETALFLHEIVAEEFEDRLSVVNKSFTAPAIVTGHPAFWQGRFPHARVIADDDTLTLEPGAHDLLIHAMCLHWAGDPVGQLIQMRRALRPDGLMLAGFAGGGTLQELRSALAQAEADVTGGLSPRVLPMGEIRDLGALLQRSGFTLPVADRLPLTVEYTTPLKLMHELRAMGETNAMADRPRQMMRRAVLERACKIYRDTYATASGAVTATFELIFLTGWAPDDSQPQPLRPGSATTRLADALGTEETPLED